MAILLNRLNARRVHALLRAAPTYVADRAVLTREFLGCPSDNSGFTVLARYGLSARDLDLRYAYASERYATLDFSDSYFDGASTTHELLAAAVLQDLISDRPELREVARLQTLGRLYFSNSHRRLDAEFMAAADELGAWIRTPFPEWQAKAKLRPRPNPLEVESVARLCRLL